MTNKANKAPFEISPKESKLLQELQVHQIELENAK